MNTTVPPNLCMYKDTQITFDELKKEINKRLNAECQYYPASVSIVIDQNTVTPFPVFTGRWKEGETWYGLMHVNNGDGALLAGLNLTCRTNRTIKYIIDWLERNLFNYMLSTIATQSKTETVRLRIGYSMIMSVESIDKSTLLLYGKWIQDLYWARKRAITEWRIDNIEKIPF